MKELRKRFIRDLTISNYAAKSVKMYVYAISKLAQYYNQCPSELSEEQLKDYLLFLVSEQKSWSTINIVQSAMRRFYRDTLLQATLIENIKRPKRDKTVKTILSRAEVSQILDLCNHSKHKVVLMVMYACGLRVSEVCQLKVEDVDSDRMLIQVKNPKGHKERNVKMPQELLDWLRIHVRQNPTKDYIFKGRDKKKSIPTGTVQKLFKRKVKQAGILKQVSTHDLRHTHTTHCIEEGSDLLAVKRNLGHKSFETTLTYYHLTQRLVRTYVSPLETLPGYGRKAQ